MNTAGQNKGLLNLNNFKKVKSESVGHTNRFKYA
jgi:hypothetical protein